MRMEWKEEKDEMDKGNEAKNINSIKNDRRAEKV